MFGGRSKQIVKIDKNALKKKKMAHAGKISHSYSPLHNQQDLVKLT